MADSDRSRSPLPGRNRTELRGLAPAARPDLPFFPRWRGPMNTSILHFQNMPRPQFRPQWATNQSGPMGRMRTPTQSMMQTNWSNQQFPPTPPQSPPPTLPYPAPSHLATPPFSPTLPCPPTQPCSPRTPSVPSSQPRQYETIPSTSPKGPEYSEATRTYGFDLNLHWQENKDHYDNQKVNGLTFPRSIRQSAFTQMLDIEGCDPLTLPVAALLYQQANNLSGFGNWLMVVKFTRSLPGDIATVVFMTELLTQLRNRGVDLDKVSHCRARQDGKLLDKYVCGSTDRWYHPQLGTNPYSTADPDTQHELTQLRSQLAQLRQKVGKDTGDTSTSPTTGPSASSPATTPIQRALIIPHKQVEQSITSTNTCLRPIQLVGLPLHCQSLACTTHATHIGCTCLWKMAQRTSTLRAKAESSQEKAKAQGAPIPSSNSPLDDSDHLSFDTLHSSPWLTAFIFSRFPHHSNQNDGACRNPWSSTESEAEVKFGRLYRPHTLVGINTSRSQPLFATIFPISERLHSFHSHSKYAAQILYRLSYASHIGSGVQLFKKVPSTHQCTTCTSWASIALLARTRQPVHLGTHPNLHRTCRLSQSSNGHHSTMATQTQLSFHLSILPPQERHPQKTCLEHQCSIWASHALATCQTQVHSNPGPLNFDIRTVSEPSRTFETIIHALGSNTKARFEQTKLLRSNDGGLTLCYALRRLANNIQEPFRTLSLTALDAPIKWWKGKPAPKATALRAPWSLTHNLQQQLKQFLRKWHLQVLAHQVPCHTILQDGLHQTCSCSRPTLQSQASYRRVVNDTTSNVLLHKVGTFQSGGTQSIRSSLGLSRFPSSLYPLTRPSGHCGRIFTQQSFSSPQKKEYFNQLKFGLQHWTKRNGLPSMPTSDISDLSQHLWTAPSRQVTCHITKSSIHLFQQTFEGAIFHCEDKQASSLRIYCPCLYYQAIEKTFQDPSISESVPQDPDSLVASMVDSLHRRHGKSYPWAVGHGRQLPAGYIGKTEKRLSDLSEW